MFLNLITITLICIPWYHSNSFTIDGLTWKHWEYILYARTPVKTNVSLSRKNLWITRAKRFFMLFIHYVIVIWSKTSCFISANTCTVQETYVTTIHEPIRKYTCYKNCQHPWFKWNLICKKLGILNSLQQFIFRLLVKSLSEA